MESPELSLAMLFGIGAALLIAGVVIGLLLGRRQSPGAQKYREVERRLDQVLQDKKAYEDEVVEHFSQTAQLLNQLTSSYRDVHNHLASGAEELCMGRGPVALDQISRSQDPSEIPQHLADIQPPLDYAPKASPDETDGPATPSFSSAIGRSSGACTRIGPARSSTSQWIPSRPTSGYVPGFDGSTPRTTSE